MFLKSKKPSRSPQLSGEPLTQPLNTSTKANDVAFLGMKPLIQLHIGYIFFLHVRSGELRQRTMIGDYWGYCEQERGTYLEICKWEEISTQIRLMNMISDSLTSCTDSNFVSCLLFLAFNVLVLMYLIEQVERGAGTSGKTEKIKVTNKHGHVKEETDSNDSEFWMLKSSFGSESE
ncbi:hypothetical protein YC2023_068116 [Brassica napus]